MFDYSLMILGLFTLMAHLLVLAIAFACGLMSLLLLRKPNAKNGMRLAMVALGLCTVTGVWSVIFCTPWRFPNARAWLWMPFVPLPIAASASTLWGLRAGRLSSTLRLMVVVGVIAVTLAGGTYLQRWDRRRERVYWAAAEERSRAGFIASAEASERCEGHLRRGKSCDRCRGAVPDAFSYYAREARKAAADTDERAKRWRLRADLW